MHKPSSASQFLKKLPAIIILLTLPAFGEVIIQGERLDPSALGPGVVETMEQAVARHLAAPPKPPTAKTDPSLRYGEWAVPGRRIEGHPHSGEHFVVNAWGDIRMGIGFPEAVEVHGAYFAAHENEAITTSGIQVIGYLDDIEVGRTDWFRHLGNEPRWFDMDLCGVDRIILLAEAKVNGSAWYEMDDLTYSFAGAARNLGVHVVDFDDLSYDTKLSTKGYAGLDWEFGTGFDLSRGVPAPQVPPGMEGEYVPGQDEGVDVVAGGNATAPDFDFGFQTVKRGDAGQFSYPPDPTGAVGPNHFVETVNRNFAVYSKSNGAQLQNINIGSFLPGSSGDPRVVFDPNSQRWIVLVTDFSSGSNIYLAVSLTNNPMGSWFKTSFFTAQGSDAGKWPDYPTLGVDANGIYTSAYMVGGNNRMTIFAIDKAPLISASPSLGTVTAFRELPWEGAIQPVLTYGNPGGEYLVSRNSSTAIRLRRINPPLTAPTLSELGTIAIASHSSPPDANSQGSSTPLDTVGDRLMMSVYRDGSLWTTHTVGVDGVASCRWYQIDPVAESVIQYGTVHNPNIHFFFPSIMVNRYGHVAMGFTGSNGNMYASAYYTGRRSSDPPGNMAEPIQYKAGLAAQNNIDQYGRNRWGDYSYTSLDPTDEVRIWTVQEYAHSNNIWGTWVAVLNAGDCNDNGVRDECEVSCGAAGGVCDVPGCGTAEDCDGNNVPDECDPLIGSCCLVDGTCCNSMNEFECTSQFGRYYGDGTDCDGPLDPPCVPLETRFNCVPEAVSVVPGGTVAVEVNVEEVSGLFTYQVAVQSELLSGTGELTTNCDSCTGGPNEPGCGARINKTRSDYVFFGMSDFTGTACGEKLVSASLFSGDGVDVSDTPDYVGEFLFTVSPDATPGSQFSVSLVYDIAQSYMRDLNSENILYLSGSSTIVTVSEPAACLPPDVIGEGSKTLNITPVGADPMALLVTGIPQDSTVACVSAYVQANGTLGPNPVFQLPSAWGTIGARGLEIIPGKTYRVQSNCGSPGNPSLSLPATGTTWVWGDVASPQNNLANFADVLAVIRAFQNDLTTVTIARADIEPCLPNRVVNFSDVLRDVKALQGVSYTAVGCASPCP